MTVFVNDEVFSWVMNNTTWRHFQIRPVPSTFYVVWPIVDRYRAFPQDQIQKKPITLVWI